MYFTTRVPGDSVVKNQLAMQETWVQSLGGEDPLEEEMATYSSMLAWEVPWPVHRPEEPVGSQRVGHDWVTNTQTHCNTKNGGKKTHLPWVPNVYQLRDTPWDLHWESSTKKHFLFLLFLAHRSLCVTQVLLLVWIPPSPPAFYSGPWQGANIKIFLSIENRAWCLLTFPQNTKQAKGSIFFALPVIHTGSILISKITSRINLWGLNEIPVP